MTSDFVAPPSEQNPPEDRSQGWKVWDHGRLRYWMGSQWSETYKNNEGGWPSYESIPKQVQAVRYGKDEGGEFYSEAVRRVALFMSGRKLDDHMDEHQFLSYLRPEGNWDPSQGAEFSRLTMWDGKAHEAWLPLALGDYVIRGINGEFYPCKADIFWVSYKKID